ncbi:hypothetical protein Hanom_Chr02g00132041 [Helianthus anomalus]
MTKLPTENYTLYFDSLSCTGGSKAEIHCSHAPFFSICHTIQQSTVINHYTQFPTCQS